MSGRRWVTNDGRFGARMPPLVCDTIEDHIRDAHPKETGGVLVGMYDDALAMAIITEASGPPADSLAGRWWFQRGAKHLATWMRSLWSKPIRQYYLGEWHYHPASHVDPSPDDLEQMAGIAESATYNCPEPLMFIFGNSKRPMRTVRVFVHPRGENAIELDEIR